MTFFSETHMVHHILILDRLSVSQVWCPRATLELALFCFWWVGMLIWFWGFFLHMSILCIFNWHPRYKWRSNRNFFEISRLANSLWCPLMISWQVSIIILKFFIRLWLGSLGDFNNIGLKMKTSMKAWECQILKHGFSTCFFLFIIMSHFQTICLNNDLIFFWGQKFQVRKLPHVYLSDCTVMGQTPSPSNILKSLQFFRFWGVVPARWIHGCWPAPATPAKHWLWREPKFWKLSHGVFTLFDPRIKLLQNLCALLIFPKKNVYTSSSCIMP